MKRDLQNTSLAAYRDPSNAKRRMSHRMMIASALKSNSGAFTIRQISGMTGLSYNQVQKRLSDLNADGHVVIVGTKEENGNQNSIYRWGGGQLDLADQAKKKTRFDLLKETLKGALTSEKYAEIMNNFKQKVNGVRPMQTR